MFHDVSIMFPSCFSIFIAIDCHYRRALVELVIWCSFRADGGTLDEVLLPTTWDIHV